MTTRDKMLGSSDYDKSFRKSGVVRIFIPKSSYCLTFTCLIKFVSEARCLVCVLSEIFVKKQCYINVLELLTRSTWMYNCSKVMYNRDYIKDKCKLKLNQCLGTIFSRICSYKIHPPKNAKIILIIQDRKRYDARL